MEDLVIEPVKDASRHSTQARLYDFAALVAVTVLNHSREFGMGTSKMLPVLEWIRSETSLKDIREAEQAAIDDKLPTMLVYDLDRNVTAVTKSSEGLRGGYMFVVPLLDVVEHLLEQIDPGWKTRLILGDISQQKDTLREMRAVFDERSE